MGTLGIVIFFGLIGGIAVGLQGPLASLMSQKLGTLESVFYIHIGGALVALVPLLFYGGRNLSRWREVPWYALGAGAFGLIVIAAMSYMVPRVGVAPAV
ncbi:MAG: DMT family transporter, partial [Anaerolineae bacterium]|nr:DMT family transporter [Anaerolineae bacterium]